MKSKRRMVKDAFLEEAVTGILAVHKIIDVLQVHIAVDPGVTLRTGGGRTLRSEHLREP